MSNENRGERIVRYTAEEVDEMIARGEDQTDWERVKNMTEEELEASIDVEEEGEFDLDTVYVGMPPVPVKKRVALWFDFNVIEWFWNQGPDYETRINEVLRAYVDAQREKEARNQGFLTPTHEPNWHLSVYEPA